MAPEDGLVAYYPFNGNANDESGNGNNGTVYGAILTEDRFGNPDSAYSFDGADDYIEVLDDDTLDLSGGLTISAWINSSDTSGARDIVAKWGAGLKRSYIFKDHNWSDKLRIELSKGGSSVLADLEGTSSIIPGNWIHVCATYDSTAVKLYFNGTQDATSPASGVITSSDASLIIGGVIENSVLSECFGGILDDIRIYNRALSEEEIQELFHEGLPGPVITPPTQAGSSEVGTTVTYTLQVTNRTGSEDSFDLSVSGNAWPTSLSMDNTGTIPDDESVTITVEVEVPTLALPGDTDEANVTATSVSDPTMKDAATVTTKAATPPPPSFKISIRSYIDGRSLLIIRVNTAQWHHLDWAAPGRLDFVCFPTVINGSEWYPEWPDVPDEENRRECFSSIYEDLAPALPETEVEVELRVIQARHSISIAQHPSIDNDYTLIVDFNDNPLGGADWYECELTVNVLIVEATVDFDPDTLNLKSKGKVVTVYIELPEGYDVEETDISTVMLNGIVPALAHPTDVGDYDSDGVPNLMVKFDRSHVQNVLEPGNEVEVTVSGQLTDGTTFEGTDTIRVIEKEKK